MIPSFTHDQEGRKEMTAPTIGQIVHYKLTEQDVQAIDEKYPMIDADGRRSSRNRVNVGDVFPAMVVRVFDADHGINLQVSLDGDMSYWATSRQEGDGHGFWFWPPRV
jgi:hypothetical protein